MENIVEQTARINQVAFVFHPWADFNNLGPDGFRIPAVPMDKIPGMTLLPLFSIQQKHIDSRLDRATNKFVPMPIAYTQSIYASYIDLLQRYGAYGLDQIAALACILPEATRLLEVFDLMMEPFSNGGKLEDLCDYLGETSPVKDQFESTTTRVRTTAENKLKSLLVHDLITEDEKNRFLAAIPQLAACVVKAHRRALDPAQGVLPQSIEEINSKRKPKFDQVDNWLRQQFPGYNSDSLLSKSSGNNDISKLTDVLTQIVTNNQAQPAIQQAAAGLSPEALSAAIAAIKADPSLLEGPAKPYIMDMIPDNQDQSDAALGLDLSQNQGSSESLELDTSKCLGIAASTNKQCGRIPDGKQEYPLYCPGHQDQGKAAAEAATAVDDPQTAEDGVGLNLDTETAEEEAMEAAA